MTNKRGMSARWLAMTLGLAAAAGAAHAADSAKAPRTAGFRALSVQVKAIEARITAARAQRPVAPAGRRHGKAGSRPPAAVAAARPRDRRTAETARGPASRASGCLGQVAEPRLPPAGGGPARGFAGLGEIPFVDYSCRAELGPFRDRAGFRQTRSPAGTPCR